MGAMQTEIERKLEALTPVHLEVSNESHMHNVPPDSESHFKVVIAADCFAGKRLLARHRLVNAALSAELSQIHALALHTMTPDEWFERAGQAPDSPLCAGGSAADRTG
ncbi:MAG: BolA/IbaG family iron-sulfur metabolism protein [Gammaproteobacteria bacterium]|nr:BolA/IbaG family iron-sulfur metabolism protein [Gammaproteobacteria bacterium]